MVLDSPISKDKKKKTASNDDYDYYNFVPNSKAKKPPDQQKNIYANTANVHGGDDESAHRVYENLGTQNKLYANH